MTAAPLLSTGSLFDQVREQAVSRPDAVVYRFLERGAEVSCLTFEQLVEAVESTAALVMTRTRAGDRVALVFAPGTDFAVAFWACLATGRIAVPVYPPTDRAAARRTAAIFDDAGVSAVLTTSDLHARLRPLRWTVRRLNEPRWLSVDAACSPSIGPLPGADSGDIALLQYTSGSTGDPKGVMVTHANLAANVAAIAGGVDVDESDVAVGWLPQYHDMGLIGCVISAACVGFEYVGMAPWDFLADPFEFLSAVSRYGGTASAMPNFGFDLCVRKVTPEQRATLDLSTWRASLNGAEPVRASTLRAFTDTFAACGLDPRAVQPTYGLAEATLAVTTTSKQGAVVATFDDVAVGLGQLRPVAADAPRGRELVSSGSALPGVVVRIVDTVSRHVCPQGQVGEIWVGGPGAAAGYIGRPELSAEVFGNSLAGEPGRFLRTGDLGALVDGQLFVTGRRKDVIIVRGRNLYPHDIERAVEASNPVVRPGCVAAFATVDGATEGLVVVAELRAPTADAATCSAVRDAVVEESGVCPRAVLLVKSGTLLKTTSGKLRRRAVSQAFAAGQLTPVRDGRWDADADHDEPWPVDLPNALATDEVTAFLDAVLADFGVGRSGSGADRLSTLGLDSIRAVEFAHRVEVELGVTLPAPLLASDATLEELADAIREAPQTTSVSEIEAPADQAAVVEGLTDDEVARLLASIEGDPA